MQPDDATRVGITPGPPTGATATPGPGESLAPRVLALYQRVVEMERAVGLREWWLLGRDLPEAQALSEIVSLLAVAHGELAQVLEDVFGTPVAGSEGDAATIAAGESHVDDPQWVHARLTEARHLLDRAATVLPALLQYAQVLRTHAQRQGLPGEALDVFAIVADRLDEACELLRHPPERFTR